MTARPLRRLFRSLQKYGDFFRTPATILGELRGTADLLLTQHTHEFRRSHPNPLARFGQKCFSQGDEDGITLEALRRMWLAADGTYAEIGVGDGTENNSLILAALGWKGFWIGAEPLAFDYRPGARFRFYRDWVTRENLLGLVRGGMSDLAAGALDFVSIDVDGNDYYLAEALLEAAIHPKLFVIEYNAKFPPPVRFRIAYDPAHTWKGDDYTGASLQSLAELFQRHGYRLVCCNPQTGANAFFVRGDCAGAFADVPADIAQIYVAPRYRLYHRYGHKQSAKLLEQLVRDPA